MPHLFKWLFRPGVLIGISLVLVLAAAWVFFPFDTGSGRPRPLPVRPGEQEIVWLYPATSTSQWERLARAVQQASERLQETFPDLEWQHNAGLEESRSDMSVPEMALNWPEGKGRLVIRWYKLTSEWTPAAWIEALLARQPPPLAIVGGNNTYWAHELANELHRRALVLPEAQRPLLLLTNATADLVPAQNAVAQQSPAGVSDEREGMIPLIDVYPGRTYRFCFTNRQMASAVTRFLWGQPDLRPDGDPACLVQWEDDSYSKDLFYQFMRVLRRRVEFDGVSQWAWLGGAAGLGLPPAALTVAAGVYGTGFRMEVTAQLRIASSVGSFSAPNPFEAEGISRLLTQLQPGDKGRAGFLAPLPGGMDEPDPASLRVLPRRPLMVLTGQSQPSRRLLRELARSAPDTARRFVVATGDGISFNTIYRDGPVTWPIQDLPFTLVLFCHQNPIAGEAGFVRVEASGQPAGSSGEKRQGRESPLYESRVRASGTEDLLLYRDIIEAVSLAFLRDGQPCATADGLADGLRLVHQTGRKLNLSGQGVPLFSNHGRRSGTGEHLVCLKPCFRGERILPRAVIEVWAHQPDRSWQLVEAPLVVPYNENEVLDDRDIHCK